MGWGSNFHVHTLLTLHKGHLSCIALQLTCLHAMSRERHGRWGWRGFLAVRWCIFFFSSWFSFLMEVLKHPRNDSFLFCFLFALTECRSKIVCASLLFCGNQTDARVHKPNKKKKKNMTKCDTYNINMTILRRTSNFLIIAGGSKIRRMIFSGYYTCIQVLLPFLILVSTVKSPV